MKIKSTVLQVLAAASLGAGLLYALGIEGGAHRKVHKEPQNTVKGKRKVG